MERPREHEVPSPRGTAGAISQDFRRRGTVTSPDLATSDRYRCSLLGALELSAQAPSGNLEVRHPLKNSGKRSTDHAALMRSAAVILVTNSVIVRVVAGQLQAVEDAEESRKVYASRIKAAVIQH
jgi:hypothetical protein